MSLRRSEVTSFFDKNKKNKLCQVRGDLLMGLIHEQNVNVLAFEFPHSSRAQNKNDAWNDSKLSTWKFNYIFEGIDTNFRGILINYASWIRF